MDKIFISLKNERVVKKPSNVTNENDPLNVFLTKVGERLDMLLKTRPMIPSDDACAKIELTVKSTQDPCSNYVCIFI